MNRYRLYRRLLIALLPVVIILATIGMVVAHRLAAAAPVDSSSGSATLTWLAFQDRQSNVDLAIQLGSTPADTASFQIVVGGVGNYQGEVPISQSGPITHLVGTVTAAFTPEGASRPQDAQVRLDGIVDSVHHTTSTEIWIDGQHYHVADRPADPASAPVVVQQALDAIVQQDWSTLYGLLASPLQSQFTRDQFIAASVAQTEPTIASATTNGAGSLSTVADQETWQQPVTLTVKNPDGTLATYTTTMTLVSEGGQWYVLGTGSPAQS